VTGFSLGILSGVLADYAWLSKVICQINLQDRSTCRGRAQERFLIARPRPNALPCAALSRLLPVAH
jgi:hypothetical protein